MTQPLAYAGTAPSAQLFGRSRSTVPSAGRRIRPTFRRPPDQLGADTIRRTVLVDLEHK